MTEEIILWRKSWLVCINELTSYELQIQSWLNSAATNPHWSFIEFMCCYFDGLSIGDDYKIPLEKQWISVGEFEIVKDWHEALRNYNSPNNDDCEHEAILNDPKWLTILQLGFSARNILAEILHDGEKRLLTEHIDYM